jgi:hypothetical protein
LPEKCGCCLSVRLEEISARYESAPTATKMKKQLWQWSLGMVGLFCILSWIGLFTAGLFIDAKNYSGQLSKDFDIGSLIVVCIVYTPTNAAMLTCLAGLAGGISSRLTYERLVANDGDGRFRIEEFPKERLIVWVENPLASMLRSFVVYLLFVAGLAVASPQNPFADPTPAQYLRFAAMVSVVGFLAGFDPSVFSTILENLPWARRRSTDGSGSPDPSEDKKPETKMDFNPVH